MAITVSLQVLSINHEVVITVQLPELAVDDIEVFIGEVSGDFIDVILLLQFCQHLEGGRKEEM